MEERLIRCLECPFARLLVSRAAAAATAAAAARLAMGATRCLTNFSGLEVSFLRPLHPHPHALSARSTWMGDASSSALRRIALLRFL